MKIYFVKIQQACDPDIFGQKIHEPEEDCPLDLHHTFWIKITSRVDLYRQEHGSVSLYKTIELKLLNLQVSLWTFEYER